ncbi:MAG: Eco57I restriction-modification methylase domain-containing protein [Candidatus Kapabacteria bacterium]|nr:Eco57I restriction-modification methylase domain-containing protein [Candidatus Kapabacteria bacterium]
MNLSINYNPDILTCLANLSNDEVFTPPHIVNQMLDLLPPQLFNDPRTTFLDPVSKTGVFLREIAKRLMVGLAPIYPDEQERRNHILQNQVFGIAITDLTSLLSRRSLYGSKKANHPKYSFCTNFGDNEQGNILYNRIEHTFKNDKCIFCGANKETYGRDDTRENYAYQFIHTDNPETLFNMKFDVIIGNPPYQLSDGSGNNGKGAIPLYHLFVQQAKKLNPRFLSMIIPAKWYSGGRGLNDFRHDMLNDDKISTLVDFSDSRDCFTGVDIAGGICYFLRDQNFSGVCNVINVNKQSKNITQRRLNKFDLFVRDNLSLDLIDKIINKSNLFLSSIVSSKNPFGFPTNFIGKDYKFENSLSLVTSKGITYVDYNEVLTGSDLIKNWKVLLSEGSFDHGGQPDKEGKRRIFSKVEVLMPNVICTGTYLVIGKFQNKEEAFNLANYLKTKFCRFLVGTILLTQHISKDKFQFVPMQDFTEEWTDEKLYKKYGLTEEEIAYIESIIRPMDATLFDDTPQEIEDNDE